ncbi:type II toxin-antitoxin system PemK/MazF family toxin [Leptolyngbya boryana CZ1]|uniref:mRNA interferase n=1 Tax=Leptolyngbya boryana CZ1 TaxID=3060204 RepID=A0AA97ASU4_LEPBY|nr:MULTISPECIES: type II toxin-antitoxin system PemK/MazF family toxin [Leptolyngbya]WNZ47859.1 type II toxin-antitoxin system PemK/MazF family toxin [Leptolyngbya boryana CZ1]
MNISPKRGEVWLVNFDPTVGSEIKKVRPAIILSSDQIGRLPIKLIAPITDWKDYFEQNLWHVQIQPDAQNGLSKVSAIDTLQIRGVDTRRFIRKLGQVPETTMQEIGAAIASLIEFQIELSP